MESAIPSEAERKDDEADQTGDNIPPDSASSANSPQEVAKVYEDNSTEPSSQKDTDRVETLLPPPNDTDLRESEDDRRLTAELDPPPLLADEEPLLPPSVSLPEEGANDIPPNDEEGDNDPEPTFKQTLSNPSTPSEGLISTVLGKVEKKDETKDKPDIDTDAEEEKKAAKGGQAAMLAQKRKRVQLLEKKIAEMDINMKAITASRVAAEDKLRKMNDRQKYQDSVVKRTQADLERKLRDCEERLRQSQAQVSNLKDSIKSDAADAKHMLELSKRVAPVNFHNGNFIYEMTYVRSTTSRFALSPKRSRSSKAAQTRSTTS